MSSSNITHSDKHKNIAGYLRAKNETQSKSGNHGQMNSQGKHDSLNLNTVHGIKDSKKHVPMNIHTKNAHSVTGEHAHEPTKHHEATNTHGKITTHAHSDTRGISRKSNVPKQRMDKQNKIEHDKTDHSKMDHAVFISISSAPEDTSSEKPDTTEQNQL